MPGCLQYCANVSNEAHIFRLFSTGNRDQPGAHNQVEKVLDMDLAQLRLNLSKNFEDNDAPHATPVDISRSCRVDRNEGLPIQRKDAQSSQRGLEVDFCWWVEYRVVVVEWAREDFV